MKSPIPYLFAAVGGAYLLLLGLPSPSQGQSASGDSSASALAALVDDLSAQQATLLENQAKIDEKLALVAEDVRQARLFVARGGGAKK